MADTQETPEPDSDDQSHPGVTNPLGGSVIAGDITGDFVGTGQLTPEQDARGTWKLAPSAEQEPTDGQNLDENGRFPRLKPKA
ncbi:hypothetical protein ACIOUE_38010 [Streptomyces xanthochromogenes]|uniref:hypothetical protein n=1 Tax=Streptomyces xanthochromogenes TaxID=67384 RepID=UPI003818B8EF